MASIQMFNWLALRNMQGFSFPLAGITPTFSAILSPTAAAPACCRQTYFRQHAPAFAYQLNLVAVQRQAVESRTVELARLPVVQRADAVEGFGVQLNRCAWAVYAAGSPGRFL